MKKFFLLPLFIAPVLASAAVGIPSGVLWCNRVSITAGDKVMCSTVVSNPESVEARGTVEFLVNGKVAESKQVFVSAGEYKTVDFNFVALEGKQEYLARVVKGEFVDNEGIPIPISHGVKVPLVTSAVKMAVSKYTPPPLPTPVLATTTVDKVVVTGSSTPLDMKSLETKIHDVLPEKVATPVSSVTLPVVRTIEDFRTKQDASNTARIGAVLKDLESSRATSTAASSKSSASTTTPNTKTPWRILGDDIKSGQALSTPWSHVLLLASLIWKLIVHTWWVFYLLMLGVIYELFLFARGKWRGY